MLVGMGALGWNILETGGGLAQVMANVAAAAPRGAGSEGVLLSPTSGGALATSLLLSAWVLVGFGTLGLPQSAVRCMSYRRSSDLHQAMIVSTVVCGALMIGMTVMGGRFTVSKYSCIPVHSSLVGTLPPAIRK